MRQRLYGSARRVVKIRGLDVAAVLFQDARMGTHRTWRILAAVGLFAACGFSCGCGSKRRSEEKDHRRPSGREPRAVSETLRGVLVLRGEGGTFTACGDTVASWVIDRTGGDLEASYAGLGPGPYGAAYVEMRADREAAPKEGPGAAYRDAVAVTALRRVAHAHEGGGCDEPRNAWEFRARGNEPFWGVVVSNGTILFTQPDEPQQIQFPYAAPQIAARTRTYSTSTSTPAPHRLDLVLEERRCSDSMSGEIFPWVARATLDGQELRGCASEGEWSPTP